MNGSPIVVVAWSDCTVPAEHKTVAFTLLKGTVLLIVGYGTVVREAAVWGTCPLGSTEQPTWLGAHAPATWMIGTELTAVVAVAAQDVDS